MHPRRTRVLRRPGRSHWTYTMPAWTIPVRIRVLRMRIASPRPDSQFRRIDHGFMPSRKVPAWRPVNLCRCISRILRRRNWILIPEPVSARDISTRFGTVIVPAGKSRKLRRFSRFIKPDTLPDWSVPVVRWPGIMQSCHGRSSRPRRGGDVPDLMQGRQLPTR